MLSSAIVLQDSLSTYLTNSFFLFKITNSPRWWILYFIFILLYALIVHFFSFSLNFFSFSPGVTKKGANAQSYRNDELQEKNLVMLLNLGQDFCVLSSIIFSRLTSTSESS